MGREFDAVHPVALHAVEDSRGRTRVKLNEILFDKRHLVPWLHHRVIDLLEEQKLLEHLDEDLEDRLSKLCPEIMSDYVAALFEEGEDAVKRQNEEADEAFGRKEVSDG